MKKMNFIILVSLLMGLAVANFASAAEGKLGPDSSWDVIRADAKHFIAVPNIMIGAEFIPVDHFCVEGEMLRTLTPVTYCYRSDYLNCEETRTDYLRAAIDSDVTVSYKIGVYWKTEGPILSKLDFRKEFVIPACQQ